MLLLLCGNKLNQLPNFKLPVPTGNFVCFCLFIKNGLTTIEKIVAVNSNDIARFKIMITAKIAIETLFQVWYGVASNFERLLYDFYLIDKCLRTYMLISKMDISIEEMLAKIKELFLENSVDDDFHQ